METYPLSRTRIAVTLVAVAVAFSAARPVRAQAPFRLVNPLTGTAHDGQTVPFVGPPYAMTNWTPETRATETKCIAPYYYKDATITGFRGSHWMSGSCTQDYGSVTVMPVTSEAFALKPEDRASTFDRSTEVATPASYSVVLKRYRTRVEMTATPRVGVLRLTFPSKANAVILLQTYSLPQEGFVHVLADTEMVVGYNPVHRIYQGQGLTAGFSGYFAARFHIPFKAFGTWCGQLLQPNVAEQGDGCAGQGAYVTLGDTLGRPVQMEVGTSFTSVEEAKANLEAEVGDRTFDQVEQAARAAWEKSLNRIEVSGGSVAQRKVFYTALYHSLLGPRPTNDVDGSYNGFAQSGPRHLPPGDQYYDDYSLWDTFRALHPLLTLIDPARQEQMVQSLVLKGTQGGFLPIFPAWGNYTSEMIGDHAAILFVDAYRKGLRQFDVAAAYTLALKNATVTPDRQAYVDGKGRRALLSYTTYGFIPLEDPVAEAFHQREQVSRTLEYAYDDAMLSEWALALGKTEDAAMLRKRSQNWRNVLDPAVGFVRGRHADGSWIEPFDASKPAFYITEGVPWQYTFFVPQDVPALMDALGGKQRFIAKLDGIFANKLYDQGNEPSHHIAYLYNRAGAPGKTQAKVHELLGLYTDGPEGLPGNDDDGQMSAWFVMSAMGLYPVCPGRPFYDIGSPLFSRIVLHHEDGTTFVIDALGNNGRTPYIQRAMLNEHILRQSQIDHASLMGGGTLQLTMGKTENPGAFDSPQLH